MNLRILKKLSKRAAPLLPLLGETREQFPAAKHDSYTNHGRHDRKHWARTRVPYPFERDLKYRPKDGRDWIVMRQPSHPWKGTIMVGAMSGYEEPEWNEETAYEALLDIVYWHYTDMTYITDSSGDAEWPQPVCNRDLSTPRLVFAAAREMIEAVALARKEG